MWWAQSQPTGRIVKSCVCVICIYKVTDNGLYQNIWFYFKEVTQSKFTTKLFFCFQLPFFSSRAVQLGSLYVRGLSHLLGANCASGCPLPSAALMPWHSFDGRLFHSKYLLAHSGTEKAELLDHDVSGDGTRKMGHLWMRQDFRGRKKWLLIPASLVLLLFINSNECLW